MQVSIDVTATNADLAKEVATTLNQPSVTLEISGGFELRDQDGVDSIAEGDIVTAKLANTPRVAAAPPPPLVAEAPALDTTDRFRFTFVTAQQALSHARATPRECTEALNGTVGFDGEFISGNITLRDLQVEAARVLQWSVPEDSMDVDCVHHTEGVCSCEIAQEIERHGLSTTCHCRFSVDGSPCGDAECPYSHAELTGSMPSGAPHCSICMDALAFPCPPCLARAEKTGDEPASVRFCPLVQNAGCGHLHHAHCVGPRTNPAPANCPSGCAMARFPREATDFFEPLELPHLVMAWDGDKIERIPVPGPNVVEGVSRDVGVTVMTTDAVVAIVEATLQRLGFYLPGLSLHIHFRDPMTECVYLLYSFQHPHNVIPLHLNRGQRRFALFPALMLTPNLTPSPPSGPSIDLHTSHAPIIACGCTPIKQLFTPAEEIVLYVVKRRVQNAEDNGKRGTASKETMYLADAAWHPSVPQTPRGIAALLSSLYVFAHSVAQKGSVGEQRVLALAFAVLRFPPAIRTLAGLIMNKVPRPEEKAALAEALFCGLKEFSSRGPQVITSRDDRRFETVRILLAYIASAAPDATNPIPALVEKRAVEEISLVCALSRKRLVDPVYMDSTLAERSVAGLYIPGGALYRPTHTGLARAGITEVPDSDVLRRLLPRVRDLGASVSTMLVLRVEDIGAAPREMMAPLDSAARDFVAAIRRANQGDLVSQGPLELKSVDVVPPRIVVDQEGLLAVFTGRGCGTTRDVNFSVLRSNGGDTEVDVNDVSHALQKVIEGRKVEDTWHVDCFGEVSAVSRPPDEAVVLCLDLSESMNEASGLERPAHRVAQAPAFDVEAETAKIVTSSVANMSYADILRAAKVHLQEQHTSCHRPWAVLIMRPGQQLLRRLAILASKELLRLKFNKDSEQDGEDSDDDGGAQDPLALNPIRQLACFVSAVANTTMAEALRLYLIQLVRDSADSNSIGEEPFDVPRQFVDFKTGDLMSDPVYPRNAPPHTFVNRSSKDWFEQGSWPAGHCVSTVMTVTALKEATSGAELLPKFEADSDAPSISITLRHRGEETSWKLSPDTTTRTLYSLANRATRAIYSKFSLKISLSNHYITDGNGITLDQTALVDGSILEMARCGSHKRGTCELNIVAYEGADPQRLLLPKDASVLAVLSYVDFCNQYLPELRVGDITIWHGLKDAGDGVRRGCPIELDSILQYRMRTEPSIKLDCLRSMRFVPRARRSQDESKKLTRLHLLKELFNVFLNRAGSFDTPVSLVLGLVTFSAEASVDQELTPIFENFRHSLERAEAGGDTAVYDALDTARRTLSQYRSDLPDLRKRIIIVSDGEDTSSSASAQEVCLALQRARVIVDSVQVGPRSDAVLHAISVATGGYRFAPRTSLADALSIFDLETMLFSGERPPRARKPFVTSQRQLYSYQDMHLHPTDMITVTNFPPRIEHPLLKQPVRAAANLVGVTAGGGGDERMRRIMREIKATVADPHPNIDVYYGDSDMTFLKVILEAPNDAQCPYMGGTFLLTCNLPARYPRDPPEVRFVTFIMHPNVSKQGKVCIAELGRLWSSDITLKEIFSLVYGTLLTPDLENPLEIQASLKYYEDDGTYALAVADAIKAWMDHGEAEKFYLDELLVWSEYNTDLKREGTWLPESFMKAVAKRV
ncbi:hypothetical protein C8R46DRAFT_1226970 [Mycena filopes]|nr:hypothetical protein C8R46DRAFT_1226970 [Mycena filopes]